MTFSGHVGVGDPALNESFTQSMSESIDRHQLQNIAGTMKKSSFHIMNQFLCWHYCDIFHFSMKCFCGIISTKPNYILNTYTTSYCISFIYVHMKYQNRSTVFNEWIREYSLYLRTCRQSDHNVGHVIRMLLTYA